MKIEEHVVYNNDVIGREIPYEAFRELFKSYKLKKGLPNVSHEGVIQSFNSCNPKEDATTSSTQSTDSEREKSDSEKTEEALDFVTRRGKMYCDLAEYIDFYPSTYPVPKEEEQNKELERLLEEYDILPTYVPWDDMEGIFIRGTDINRLREAILSCHKFAYLCHFLATTDPDYLQYIETATAMAPTPEQEQGKSYRKTMQENLRTLRGGK